MKKYIFTWVDIYIALVVGTVVFVIYLLFWGEPAKHDECPVAAFVHGSTGCKPISHGGK